MKENNGEYVKLTNQIVTKSEEVIALKRRLNDSNKHYQETKEVLLQPWEYKYITEEISIKEKELDMLKEKRNLVRWER